MLVENLASHINNDCHYNDSDHEFEKILSGCQHDRMFATEVWGYVQIVIVLTALPLNALLIWLLLKGRTELSPSSFLSINLSILNLFYIICLTVNIYMIFHPSSGYLYFFYEIRFCFNLVGCPLLLTGMCVERYVAVVWPITYMQRQRYRCRIICCVLAWILMLTKGIAYFLIPEDEIQMWCIFMYIFILYLVMLLCLGSVIHVLHKKSPGNPESDRESVKRKALRNVVAVLVPFTLVYVPVLGLIPLVFLRMTNQYNSEECLAFYILLIFPSMGIYIGPVFYLGCIFKMFLCQKRCRETQMPNNIDINSGSVVLNETDPAHNENVT